MLNFHDGQLLANVDLPTGFALERAPSATVSAGFSRR